MLNVLIVREKKTSYFPIAVHKHVRVKSGYFGLFCVRILDSNIVL